MESNDEGSQQAIGDRMVFCLLVYCTSFLLSIWVAEQLHIPLSVPIAVYVLPSVLGIVTYYILRSCRPQRRAIDPMEPPLLPRQNSLDSCYTSQYETTNTTNTRCDVTNDDRFCQLCILKEQEKVLNSELAKLDLRAQDAYSKHSNASQFLCDHDAHKSEACKVVFDGFRDASKAWYAADLERTTKKKELLSHQKKVRELREEMEAHFWDAV